MHGMSLLWAARRLHYFSTYCLHGLHANCRITCKHCPRTCRCPCHEQLDTTP